MKGLMGRILRVDLTEGEFETIPTMDYAAKYLGGRGLASRLYWEQVQPETSAFDPFSPVVCQKPPGMQGRGLTDPAGA